MSIQRVTTDADKTETCEHVDVVNNDKIWADRKNQILLSRCSTKPGIQ